MDIKNLLNKYLEKNFVGNSEFAKVAEQAMHRSGYDKVVVFNHGKKLVMVNFIAPSRSIASGIVTNREETKILDFKNSEDRKSVSTDALARELILESVENETDRIKLRAMAKNEYSWVIHYISNKSSQDRGGKKPFPNCLCNAHTHGLEAFGHKDFQVILDVGEKNVAFLLNTLAERVRDGEMFYDKERVSGVYENCDIKLATVRDGNREVLRILIPDAQNRFPDNPDCAPLYADQGRRIDNIRV